MSECPECKGTSGVTYIAPAELIYEDTWGHDDQTTPEVWRKKLPVNVYCMDCKKPVKYQKWREGIAK